MSLVNNTFTPPTSIAPSFGNRVRIFLAGSIEMGKASAWQQQFIYDVTQSLAKTREIMRQMGLPHQPTHCFYNPRRADWNAAWKQGFEEPEFFQQVTWELDALDQATHIVLYLEPGTISPISLLELGLFARSGKLLVVCPEGFSRKGNVDVVCAKYGIQQFADLDDVADYIVREIEK